LGSYELLAKNTQVWLRKKWQNPTSRLRWGLPVREKERANSRKIYFTCLIWRIQTDKDLHPHLNPYVPRH
jgi:hypothetical protein